MAKAKTTVQNSFVRRKYVTNNIGVVVEIDFEKETISLVEKGTQYPTGEYKPKKWLFAGREVAYMNSWRDILEAMKNAIDEAEKELREYQEAVAVDKAKAIEQLMKSPS